MKSSSLSPKIAHSWIKGGAVCGSMDLSELRGGNILTEVGSILLKDLISSIISCACLFLN